MVEITIWVTLGVISVAIWDVMRRYYTWQPVQRDLEKRMDQIEKKVEEAREVAGQAATNSNILVSRYGRR